MTKPNSAAGSTSFLVAAIGIYVACFLHGASVIAFWLSAAARPIQPLTPAAIRP